MAANSIQNQGYQAIPIPTFDDHALQSLREEIASLAGRQVQLEAEVGQMATTQRAVAELLSRGPVIPKSDIENQLPVEKSSAKAAEKDKAKAKALTTKNHTKVLITAAKFGAKLLVQFGTLFLTVYLVQKMNAPSC